MLRRRPGAKRPSDAIDQQLLEGVEAEFPWSVLVRSASCLPQEAEQRLARLLSEGLLEGTLGDATTVAQPPAPRAVQPAPFSQGGRPSRAPGPSRDLLNEFRALRASQSVPPVKATTLPPASGAAGASTAASQSPPRQSLPAPANPAWAPYAISSLPPARSSLPPAGSVPPGGMRFDVDAPLGLLIAEFSQGVGIQRWSAARLREALEEELAGNFLQAAAIVQVVLAQLDDPRLRAERQRLQERAQRANSGIYRSRAREAEKARQHLEAAEQWRKVLESVPSDAEAALHAAKNFLEAGDLKQAAHFARRATQLAPNNISAHKVLLRFFQKAGMEASAQREREILAKLGRG